jgi:hypothetical protein
MTQYKEATELSKQNNMTLAATARRRQLTFREAVIDSFFVKKRRECPRTKSEALPYNITGPPACADL